MGTAMTEILRTNILYSIEGCGHEDEINLKLGNAEIVIIAVKPQSFAEMASGLKVDMSEKLVISIMAGISIEKMQEVLGVKKVVRTLPSLPLKVGQSLTVWKAADEVSAEEKHVTREILKSFGDEVEVEDENQLSLISVISGCGPAYFAYFGEKMADFLVKNGMTVEEAGKIAKQTLIGTGELVKQSGWDLQEMRERVTSKGGLTEAAIKNMEENDLGEVVEKAAEAAIKRNSELNK